MQRMNGTTFPIRAGLVCIGIILLLASGCGRGDQGMGGIGSGATAPDFSLTDINGETRELSALRGKVVLVDFWATWCPPCRMEVPHFKEIHRDFEGKDFVFIGIAIDKENAVRDFVRANQITFPIVVGDNAIAGKYGIKAFPTTYLIAKDGTIAQQWIGYQDKDVFVKAIEEELAKS